MMPETSILWSLPGSGLRGDGRSRIPLLSVLTEIIVGQGLEPRKNKRLAGQSVLGRRIATSHPVTRRSILLCNFVRSKET